MAARFGLVLDGNNPDDLARFWSDALGYTIVGSSGAYVLLTDPDRTMPNLLLQRVPEDKVAKNRMHLDIETPDVDAEVARLETLGARRLESESRTELGSTWVVMSDPQGNEFCVCNHGAA